MRGNELRSRTGADGVLLCNHDEERSGLPVAFGAQGGLRLCKGDSRSDLILKASLISVKGAH